MHAQRAALDALLTPSSGPDDSILDIRLSERGAGATVTVALPRETVVGVADVQGLFIYQAAGSGCLGEAITIDATAEGVMAVRTGSAVFTVTEAVGTARGTGLDDANRQWRCAVELRRQLGCLSRPDGNLPRG